MSSQLKFSSKHTHTFLVFLLLPCFILIGLVPNLAAQPENFNHPELLWQSIETEHFIVHFHQGTERTANLVAKIAEEIYPHITGFYQHWPKKKTEFIIRDTDDYSNGGAFFYENKVEIWAENMDYILRGTHNWLRDVVSHEYAHIISIQKSFKFGTNVPAGWLQLFGYETERRPDVVRGFPDVLVSFPVPGITIPVWFAEGVAQYQSPSSTYDYRDSHREMILRDRVMTGKLLDLKEMSVFGKNSIGNESSYNQGYAFVNFLTETYGDSVLRDLAEQTSSPLTLDFNGALKKVTGNTAEQIFSWWNEKLRDTYVTRLSSIQQNLYEGEPVQEQGIGNIHPIFSPDGNNVAYLKSTGDYLSANALVVRNLKTEKDKTIDGLIASSISWSPDGRYLIYAKQIELQANGSSYYDLYVYDLEKNKSHRITNGLRATNPDWSHDGKQIVFVVHADGLTNLFTLDLEEHNQFGDKRLWHTSYYDLEYHQIVERIPEEKKKNWKRYFRKVKWWGRDIRQITHFRDGRQVFHPRWSLDDSFIVFDTSTDFCRDIARIPSHGGEMEFILNQVYDERYPQFDPANGELYFSSDQTGIFNIYSYNFKNGEIKPHTNVVGGAFMSTVDGRGNLVYALYKNQGYKIYHVRNVNERPIEDLSYNTNYHVQIPNIENNDSSYEPLPTKPYKRSFGPVGIMPRLLMDYGTLKPGVYIYSNEVLNKMFFLGGFDFNFRKDYDIFALFDFNVLKPTIFFEFYNQSQNIKDSLNDPFYKELGEHDINFNLMEADLGLRGKFREWFDWRVTYILSLYRARIGTFAYKELATEEVYISPDIRYTYLRGHALSLSIKRSHIFPDLDRNINPRKGHYIALRYTREWNKFLEDFATDKVIDIEIYEKYYFNRYEFDLEYYFPVPFTKYHSFTARLQGGYIDQEVDDYFHFFAGGYVGLKGFSFYSIDGRKMGIGSLTYRMPLARNLNIQLLSWYLDKIYLGAFYQFGDAWNDGGISVNNLNSNIGLQLRFETFSWYMFPTRIFFEAAYPLNSAVYQDITYERDWKFYFGILFDFDIRFDKMIRRFR